MTYCEYCSFKTKISSYLFDDRYGYPGSYALQRCSKCGHCVLLAKMNSEELGHLYTDFYPRSSFDVATWSPPHEEGGWRSWWGGLKASAFRWIPPGVKVLDIGCGFGESLGYHQARGCEAHGVEADRNILRVANRYDLNVKVGLFQASDYSPNAFDFVTLDQVIEHASDPEQLLRDIHSVLKPGGTVIISTPNPKGWGARLFGRRWIHWHAPYHLSYFTPQSMRNLATRTGFDVEKMTFVTSSAWIDYQWGHLIAFPEAGKPSPFWNSRIRRTLGQKIGLRLGRWLNYTGFNNIVARLADGLRIGDNVVYVLRK